MKRTVIIILALATFAGCANNSAKAVDLKKAAEELDARYMEIVNDTTLSPEQTEERVAAFMREAYEAHKNDSLGIGYFKGLITNYCEAEEALAMYEDASEIIRGDALLKTKIEAIKNVGKVKVGGKYIDITGPDALTGKKLSISSFLGGDKPLVVDFWASWCPPCRQEIKTALTDLAATGKVNILGIAVWENSKDDTTKAMDELGVSWPVIYTGGRENSPSISYAVLGIPTLFLISPDGTILATGHSVKELGLE